MKLQALYIGLLFMGIWPLSAAFSGVSRLKNVFPSVPSAMRVLGQNPQRAVSIPRQAVVWERTVDGCLSGLQRKFENLRRQWDGLMRNYNEALQKLSLSEQNALKAGLLFGTLASALAVQAEDIEKQGCFDPQESKQLGFAQTPQFNKEQEELDRLLDAGLSRFMKEQKEKEKIRAKEEAIERYKKEDPVRLTRSPGDAIGQIKRHVDEAEREAKFEEAKKANLAAKQRREEEELRRNELKDEWAQWRQARAD